MKKIFFHYCDHSCSIVISSYRLFNKDVEGRTDNAACAYILQTSILMQVTGNLYYLQRQRIFAVAAPAATNTPDYIAQINEIKTWQANHNP